jgi:hypothetical protein
MYLLSTINNKQNNIFILLFQLFFSLSSFNIYGMGGGRREVRGKREK